MQTALIVAIVALVVALLAVAWSFALAQRVRSLTAIRGDLGRMAAAGDFVGIAQNVQARLDELAATDEHLHADDAAIVERLGFAVRHLGLVRFDALPGDVGENSFAVALMDDHATGFVLTSMYGRGAYRLYAKPVTDGVAELVLTDEEKTACSRALAGTGLTVVGDRRPRA
ncbi:MAG: DUF4446 family protein [Coriobacteriia bacterium]|nr:DUF4446 family protein [Coriobacteriia bacterium]